MKKNDFLTQQQGSPSTARKNRFDVTRVPLVDGMRISLLAHALISRRLKSYWDRTSDEIERENLWEVPFSFEGFDFGTTLRLTKLDDFKRVYGYGACAVLVESLAKRTDGKLRVWSYVKSDYGWQGHVAVHVDDTHVIDSYGLVTSKEAYARYHQFELREIVEEVLTLKEFRKRIHMGFFSRMLWKIFGTIENELAITFADLILDGLSVTVDKTANMVPVTIPPVQARIDEREERLAAARLRIERNRELNPLPWANR